MKREPLAMAQTRQFRGQANTLKLMDYYFSGFSKTQPWRRGAPRFAPNLEINLSQWRVAAAV
jgi:hypothetical protein